MCETIITDTNSAFEKIPMLALRGLTIFPRMLMHFDVGREKSIKALEECMAGSRRIFLLAQKDARTDDPRRDDLYTVGTICIIKQVLRLPNESTVRVMVEGVCRAKLLTIEQESPCFHTVVERIAPPESRKNTPTTEALIRYCCELFEQYVNLAPKPTPEVLENVLASTDAGYISDYIAQNILIRHAEKQGVLEELQPIKRLKMVQKILKREIIAGYTRESGVRVLEREIAKICRRSAMKFVSGGEKTVTVRAGNLEEYLDVRRFTPEHIDNELEVGVVNGLAWTSVGGELLEVECSVLPGTGKIELTGNLGDVMKESARTAVTCSRSRSDSLGIDPNFYNTKDIHIHFPEGAVPKDGPSAGVSVTTAIVSALTGAPVRRSVAMTGEVTLRGRVLPIGGLREKTMAAMRNGIKTVIIPADNEKDLKEIDPLVRNALNFVTVTDVDKVIKEAVDFSGFKPFRVEEKTQSESYVIPEPKAEPSRIRQ